MPFSARPTAVSVVVADMPRALAFYRTCGLDVPTAADAHDHVEVPVADGFTLMFDTVDVIRGLDSNWTPPSGGHRMALAMRCADPSEVDGAYFDLVDEGHRSVTEPFDAPWGQRYATVADPDGNPVDFFAPQS